jgi:phosphoribosylformylglycinamidine cyclo-ligase
MPLTYKDAGVDADAGDELVERIKPLARTVRIAEQLDDLGGFAGLCAVPSGLDDPVLVSGTDGVGTKLELAFATGIHDTVGVDLVAMCVNDVITTGARPLFFLDYFATCKLDVDVAEAVVRGIVEGCRQAGCALLGGETAELPGMYAPGTYDLAGFAVGVVERRRILDGRGARPGDALIGVASSGLHSNGYSLARKIASRAVGTDLGAHVPELAGPVGATLLTPTRIYARAVRELVQGLPRGAVRALCHVTGGGLPGNLPRVLPDGLGASVRLASFERPAVFRWLAAAGPVEEHEMRRTFNLGVGLCAVVAVDAVDEAVRLLESAGERCFRLGELVQVPPSTPFEERVVFA